MTFFVFLNLFSLNSITSNRSSIESYTSRLGRGVDRVDIWNTNIEHLYNTISYVQIAKLQDYKTVYANCRMTRPAYS